MKNVLVTGGSGFIGSHLCEKLLCRGLRVVNLDNFNDGYDPALKRGNIERALRCSNYTPVEGDIRDRRLLDDILEGSQTDTVIHLAALAGVRKSIENPLEYVDVDIGGTVNLLEACRTHGVEKFIFASSSSVYGVNPVPFRESDRPDFQTSPYAAAKYSGELYCRLYNRLYGLSAVCLRFFTVYGPRQRPDMAIRKFTASILEGRAIPIYGDGKSSRDYTYVDDVIEGIIASAELDCDFEIFNLGNSKPVCLTDLIAYIEAAAGVRAKTEYLPEQPGDVPTTCADISKAAALLGYSPRTALSSGIDRYVNWYMNH